MSRDAAFGLLFDEFRQIDAPALWLVDDNVEYAALPPAHQYIDVCTNRYDVYKAFNTAGWQSYFSDDISLPSKQYHTVLLRIPKEKARAHYLINQAATILSTCGGRLVMTGMKQEGIKGFIERAAHAAHCEASLWKADKQTWAGAITIKQFTPLDDQRYLTLRQAPSDAYFHFWSKPGVFGWDKIDQGSALLVEHLTALTAGIPINSVLDLGCGYGYLSLHSHRLLQATITATDNNAAAISACQQNFQHYGVTGHAFAADCADGLPSPVDCVVCNPPFHSGFGVNGDLTDHFIRHAAQYVKAQGIAIFVTNLHIPLERKAQPYFKEITTPVLNNHFKLLVLRQPHSA